MEISFDSSDIVQNVYIGEVRSQDGAYYNFELRAVKGVEDPIKAGRPPRGWSLADDDADEASARPADCPTLEVVLSARRTCRDTCFFFHSPTS